jgi:hypothetical protein
MKALPLLFALIYHTGLIAQNTTFVTVKAGYKIREVLTTADVFYYPQFIRGKVFFRDGTNAEAKLNYSHLVDEMQFVDAKGDTLALANEKTIKFISIANDTFYYDQGYVRLIAGNNVVKLAEKQVWVLGDTRKIGAYKTANSTSFITAYGSYTEHGKSYDLTTNEDVDLRKAERYFFGDKYNRFVLASKKNLLMLFLKEQRHIQTYLKENKVDFTDKEDLEKVVQLLGHL